MEGSDELLTIAELAVGLAGIAGLVVAFTRDGRLLPTDRYRFILLFSLALFAAALAFVPFGFHHAGKAGPALWSASISLLLQIANFIGWPMESGVLPYLVGLLIWLLVPALLFAALILYRAEE
jgi:hypothetical protein